jgi:hypothetical protein
VVVMADDLDDSDLDQRRRYGRELQGRLPRPLWRPPRRREPSDVEDAARVGFFGSGFGPVGLVIGAALGAATAIWSRHRRGSR